MSESIPPLDPELVRGLRDDDPAPPDVRARARERLMTAVAALGMGGREGGATPPRSLGGATGAKIAAIAFLLGGIAGATLHAILSPAPAPRVVYVDRDVTPDRQLPAPSPPAPTGDVVSAPLPSPPPAIATSGASSASPSRASQLSAERILLDEARSALARGDTTLALGRLQRHRQLFPAPLLGEERDAMWVQALVKAGRFGEARARAEAFRKRTPDSLFSSMVDSAVESIPAPP